ncbi:hypothetical protein ACFYPX_10660 [Micromonospora zamorensis]
MLGTQPTRLLSPANGDDAKPSDDALTDDDARVPDDAPSEQNPGT